MHVEPGLVGHGERQRQRDGRDEGRDADHRQRRHLQEQQQQLRAERAVERERQLVLGEEQQRQGDKRHGVGQRLVDAAEGLDG